MVARRWVLPALTPSDETFFCPGDSSTSGLANRCIEVADDVLYGYAKLRPEVFTRLATRAFLVDPPALLAIGFLLPASPLPAELVDPVVFVTHGVVPEPSTVHGVRAPC